MPGERINRRTKAVLVAGGAGIVILSLYTFLAALPSNLDPACCGSQLAAKDFSAYYVGLWRPIHDTSQVYTRGFINDGEIHVYPVQEQFKYLPSFLLMISPLALLGYQQAITAFDIFQLSLLPFIGFLVYRLTKTRGLFVAFLVVLIVLLLPSPVPGWGLSIPYFWLWSQGQAKVLEAFLILAAFYAGASKFPVASGVSLGLSFFDPRFALLAIPLFVMYNRGSLRAAGVALAASLIVSNFAFFLSPGMGAGFIRMIFSTGLTTAPYPYVLIPIVPIAILWIMNYREVNTDWSGAFVKLKTIATQESRDP